MNPNEAQAAGDIAQGLGVLGLLVLILWTGAKGTVWIFTRVRDDERKIAGERLDEMRKERDDWRTLAQGNAQLLATQTDQAERLSAINERLTSVIEQVTGKSVA